MLGINHQRGTHHSAPLQNYRRARFDDTVSEQQTVNYTNDRRPKAFVFQGIGNIEGVYFWRSATDRKWYFEDPLDNDAITCVGSRQNLQNALKERQFWWLETDKSYEDVTVTRHPDGSKSYDYEGLTDPAEITAQIDRENEEANKNSAEPSKWKGLALAAMTLIAGMPGAQTLVKNTISAPEPAQPEPQPNSTAAALRFLNNASSAPSEPAGNPNTAPESFFDYDYYSNLGFRGLQLTSGMLAAAATVKSGVVAAPLVLMAMLMNTKVVEGGIVKSHKRPAPSSVEEELAKPVTTTNSFTIPTVTSTTLPAAAPKSVYGPEAVFGPNSNVGILTKRSHHHKPTTAVPVSKRIVQRPTASSNVTNQTAVPHIPMVHLPNNQTVQSSAQTNLTKPGLAKPSVLAQNITSNVTHSTEELKQNQVAQPQPVQKTVAQVEQKATQVILSNQQTPIQGASQALVSAALRDSAELSEFRRQTEWEIKEATRCKKNLNASLNPAPGSQYPEAERNSVLKWLKSINDSLAWFLKNPHEDNENEKANLFHRAGVDLTDTASHVNLKCVRQLKTGNGFGTAPSSTPSRSLTSSPSLTPTSSPSLTPSPSLAPTSDSTPTPDDSNGSSIAWAVGGGLSTALIVVVTTAYLKGWWPSWPFGSGDAPTRDAESERSRLLNPDNTANDGDTPNDAGRPDNNVPDQLRRRSTVAPAAIKQPHERPQPVQQQQRQPQQPQQQQDLANENALLTSALDKLFNDENGDV